VKYFIIILVSFVFTACGGGSSLDNNNSAVDSNVSTVTVPENNTSLDNNSTDNNITQTVNDINNSITDYNNTQIIDESNTTDVVSESIDIQVMFSKTSGAYYDGGVDNNITNDINNAKDTIYMAMYDLTNSMITDALIDAKNRGVLVRVTTDDDTIDLDYEKYQDLIDANISVTDDDNPYALMHNKFLVIDNKIVWSGSGNYTVYSFYRNYENYVRIENEDIANSYINEFKLLDSRDDTTYIGYTFENLDIFFSPDSDFEKEIIKRINNAKEYVHFLAFSFTNQDIADALIDAKNRGVDVKGVFDEGQNDYQTYSKYDYLKDNDVDVRIDGNSYKLHSKVIIIDDNLTITGSYNFTKQANNENNENSLVIQNINIAQKYNENFNTIYNEAE